MADLKKVMEKLNSQKSTEGKAPTAKALPAMPSKKKDMAKVAKKAVVEEPEEEFDEEFDEEETPEEEPVEEEEATEEVEETATEADATEAESPEQRIAVLIERLQNNGVYRAELLYQLVELNNNFKVHNHLLLKVLKALNVEVEDGKGK